MQRTDPYRPESDQSDTKLTPSEQYEIEWIELCTEFTQNRQSVLRRLAMKRGLRTNRFRSICWGLMLRVLTSHPDNWLVEREKGRKGYAQMKEAFNKNPYHDRDDDSSLVDDPLSQNASSLWHQHFCDRELIKTIHQDVVRTFPSVEFFRDPHVQKTMENILFCYARLKPRLCYRQGMHEILGPILYVLYSDHRHLRDIQNLNRPVNHTLYDVLNPDFVEADAFALFVKVMFKMEPFFSFDDDVTPSASGDFPAASTNNNTVDRKRSDHIDVTISWMRNHVLARVDPELHNHLLEMEVPLSVIGIKWYRVLFGREFPFNELLVLWDAIFSDKFEIIKYVPATILISIRKKLLTSDFVGIYQCLTNYPNPLDIRTFIDYCFFLENPELHKAPLGVLVPRKPTTKQNNGPNVPVPLKSKSVVAKKTSAPENSLKQIIQQKAEINSRQPLTTHLRVSHHEMEIRDGYLEDDKAVLQIELQHMHTVLSITRLKLGQYVNLIRTEVQANHQPPSDKMASYLNGMQELCVLMEDTLHTDRVHLNDAASQCGGPVEPAQEAANDDDIGVVKDFTVRRDVNGARRKVPLAEKENCDRRCSNEEGSGVGSVATMTKKRSSYEFPESSRTKIAGNRKEVEMREMFSFHGHFGGGVELPDIDPTRDRADSD